MTVPTASPTDLPPMSKHHVLHLARVSAQLPSHLFRPLLVLAVHADHRTGLSRPGRAVFEEDWGIPYSSWHRQMQQLAKLGLIRQVVKGNKEAGVAATYHLLYAPPLTGERTSATSSETDPSPYRGGGATSEKGRGDHPLNSAEREVWQTIAQRVRAALSDSENRRLDLQGEDFDRMVRLQRTALRVAQRAGDFEVIDALTRSRKPGRPAYDGAVSIPAAMWSRLRTLADAYAIDMADQTAVVAPSEPRLSAADALDALNVAVPGLRETMRSVGRLR